MTFQEYCVLNFFKNTDFGVKNSLHATLLLQWTLAYNFRNFFLFQIELIDESIRASLLWNR